jgi:hypothetical protein
VGIKGLYRLAAVALVTVMSVVLSAAPASADFYMAAGPRHVVQNQPASSCSAKAKQALHSVLTTMGASADGYTLLGYGPKDSTGYAAETAAIHCYPVDNGYVVTVTCAVEVPPNPMMAKDLCAKIDSALGLQ